FPSSFQIVADVDQHTPPQATVQNAPAPGGENANSSRMQGNTSTTNTSQQGTTQPDSLPPAQHPSPTPIPTHAATPPAENAASSVVGQSHHHTTKPPTVSLMLHITTLDKSVLELLNTPGEHKELISDALNTTLKNKLAGALHEEGHATLANLAQNMGAVDL